MQTIIAAFTEHAKADVYNKWANLKTNAKSSYKEVHDMTKAHIDKRAGHMKQIDDWGKKQTEKRTAYFEKKRQDALAKKKAAKKAAQEAAEQKEKERQAAINRHTQRRTGLTRRSTAPHLTTASLLQVQEHSSVSTSESSPAQASFASLPPTSEQEQSVSSDHILAEIETPRASAFLETFRNPKVEAHTRNFAHSLLHELANTPSFGHGEDHFEEHHAPYHPEHRRSIPGEEDLHHGGDHKAQNPTTDYLLNKSLCSSRMFFVNKIGRLVSSQILFLCRGYVYVTRHRLCKCC